MKHTRSSKKIRVENHSNLARDVKTQAIVNTDSAAYNRYINDKNVRLSQKGEIDRLREEVEILKQLILKQNK
tara:strand:+ start:6390 stop:6605 length:216 start_codon:yes stop_codon:yes gene_type:complete